MCVLSIQIEKTYLKQTEPGSFPFPALSPLAAWLCLPLTKRPRKSKAAVTQRTLPPAGCFSTWPHGLLWFPPLYSSPSVGSSVWILRSNLASETLHMLFLPLKLSLPSRTNSYSCFPSYFNALYPQKPHLIITQNQNEPCPTLS